MKLAKKYKTEYPSTLHLVLRTDQWIRAVGIIPIWLVVEKKIPTSDIENEYLGKWSSDTILVIFGIVIILAIPDIIKFFRTKAGIS